MRTLPTGTVTFVFTDIEGSTRLLRSLGDAYPDALGRHAGSVRAAVASNRGTVVSTEGDAFFLVFESAPDAIRAVAEIQRKLAAQDRGIRIRIGMHTGEASLGGDDYIGLDVHRTARIAAAGHGGQVLLSATTRDLVAGSLPVDLALRDLSTHRLKDFDEPERLFQLTIDGLPTEFPPLRTTTPRTVPPPERTSFVGRELELAAVVEAIEPGRVVTLLGPGGSGKTRLAVRASKEVLARLPDGVSFVDLAALTDPALVRPAIIQAAGLRDPGGSIAFEELVAQLADQRLLLILDNCEHLLDACAGSADAILRIAPSVALLATSREPLAISGELRFEVPSLGVPKATSRASVEASDAGRLFLERARAVSPAQEITDTDAAAIAQITRRLDGIPLAIELAAARTAALSPTEIAARLDDRFRLLRSSGRTAEPRQATLEGLIAWSHDLLKPDERVLFRRLSVFAGGCTLDTCAEVCTDEGPDGPLASADLLDLMASLVAKSLVVAERAVATRYRMLESIHAYARERLVAAAEETAIRDRQVAWAVALCRRAEPELVGAHQREWFDRLDAEHDDLRAALGWARERDPQVMLTIASALYWFWQVRGHVREGREWLKRGLERSDLDLPDELRKGALLAAGSLAWAAGDVPEARRRLSDSASCAARVGDARGRAIALTILAHSLVFDGDVTGAREILAEAVPIARQVGDPFVLARALGTLADAARQADDDDQAVEVAGEALSLFEQVGMDEGIGFNLVYQAHGLRRRDPARAREQLRRALARFDAIDHPSGRYVAAIALADLDPPPPELGGRVVGALDALSERSGFGGMPSDRAALRRLEQRAADAMPESAFAALRAAGRAEPDAVLAELGRLPTPWG